MNARFVMAAPRKDAEDDRDTLRAELERLRIKLALTAAQVSEAQQQRDRAHANMEKVTACLVECQGKLHAAMEIDEARVKELNELRSLVDSHQDELQVVTEARRQVQGLFEEVRQENERLRAELAALAPVPEPEPQVTRAMGLVNVAR